MIGRILKLIIVTISKYSHYLDLANKFHCAYFDDDSIYNFKTRALEIIVKLLFIIVKFIIYSSYSFKIETLKSLF